MKNNSLILFLLFLGIFVTNAQNNETLAEIPAGFRKGKKVKVKVRPSSPTLSPAPQPPGYISKVKGKKYYDAPTGNSMKKSMITVSQASMESNVLPRSGSDSVTAIVAVQKPQLNTYLPTQNSVLPPENSGISETSMVSEGSSPTLSPAPQPPGYISKVKGKKYYDAPTGDSMKKSMITVSQASMESNVLPRSGSSSVTAIVVVQKPQLTTDLPTQNSVLPPENAGISEKSMVSEGLNNSSPLPRENDFLPQVGSENDNVTLVIENTQTMGSLPPPPPNSMVSPENKNTSDIKLSIEEPKLNRTSSIKDVILPRSGSENDNATAEHPQPLVSLRPPIQDSVLSTNLNETIVASEVPQSTVALPRSEPENITATVALDNIQSVPIISSSPVTATSKAKGSLNSAGYASSHSPSTAMKTAKPLKGDKKSVKNTYSYSYSYTPTRAPIAKNGITGGNLITTSKPTRVSKKVLPTSVGNITFTYYHQDNTKLSTESIKAPTPTTSDSTVPTASPLKFVSDSATSKAPTSLKGLKKSELSSDKPFSQAPTKVSKKILPTPIGNITFSYFDNNATTTEESARSFLNETWNADPVKQDSSTTEVAANATQPLTGLPAKSKPLQKGSRDWK